MISNDKHMHRLGEEAVALIRGIDRELAWLQCAEDQMWSLRNHFARGTAMYRRVEKARIDIGSLIAEFLGERDGLQAQFDQMF